MYSEEFMAYLASYRKEEKPRKNKITLQKKFWHFIVRTLFHAVKI